MTKSNRTEWAKLIERWQDSGLTAKEFAAELNVSPVVLSRWKRKLQKGAVPALQTSVTQHMICSDPRA